MRETLRAVVERARTVDVRAEAQAKRVAETRLASQGASFYSPLPLVADRTPSVRGTWVDAEESGAQRVDVDAEGRPLVVWYGEPLWVWTYGERRWEQLRMYGEVAWYELEDGRPAWMAGVNDHGWMLERWTWAEGAVVRVDHAEAIARGWPHAWTATAAYDSSGLVRITQAVEKGDYREDNRLAPEAVEDALEAALARAAALTPGRVAWDRSLHAREEMPDEPAKLAEQTAAAFADAALAAVAASGVVEPFLAVVQEPPNAFEPYPPDVLVVADSWRRGMLAAGRHDREVLERPWEAVDAGHGVRLPLAEHLDEDGLRGCRVLRTTLLGSRGAREAGGRLATEVGRELSRRPEHPRRGAGHAGGARRRAREPHPLRARARRSRQPGQDGALLRDAPEGAGRAAR